MNTLLEEFEHIIQEFSSQILEINEDDFNQKLEPDKWNKKEILGHLVDSAFVNYQRFIRAQFEGNPKIYYDQVAYCASAGYQHAETEKLCNLWRSVNEQLLFLFKQVIANKLTKRTCNDQSLEFLMLDYVVHLKHHRNQILSE
ncbi:MAG: DinB family protein [Sphingobacterium sp.]